MDIVQSLEVLGGIGDPWTASGTISCYMFGSGTAWRRAVPETCVCTIAVVGRTNAMLYMLYMLCSDCMRYEMFSKEKDVL